MERELERYLPPTDLLSKWLQWPWAHPCQSQEPELQIGPTWVWAPKRVAQLLLLFLEAPREARSETEE